MLYDKGNYEAINSKLLNFLSHFLPNISTCSVDDNWRIYTTHMSNLVDTFIPIISITTNSFSFEPAYPLPHRELTHHTRMSSITFSPNSIASIIDSLKLSSSTGVDEINTKESFKEYEGYIGYNFVRNFLAITFTRHFSRRLESGEGGSGIQERR